MSLKLDKFKNDIITYLNQKCPNIDVNLVGASNYNKGFMLQIEENSSNKVDYYEVNLVKYINNEDFHQADKDKQNLLQALKEFAPDKFVEDIDMQACTIYPNKNGIYSNVKYSSVIGSCFFIK